MNFFTMKNNHNRFEKYCSWCQITQILIKNSQIYDDVRTTINVSLKMYQHAGFKYGSMQLNACDDINRMT